MLPVSTACEAWVLAGVSLVLAAELLMRLGSAALRAVMGVCGRPLVQDAARRGIRPVPAEVRPSISAAGARRAGIVLRIAALTLLAVQLLQEPHHHTALLLCALSMLCLDGAIEVSMTFIAKARALLEQVKGAALTHTRGRPAPAPDDTTRGDA
ncbi:hypothetical protein [Streptomyces sp. NPDC005385]|uniref:hypothetical protein n=1 Tax=Streptomyces sp. NPDC005385 TaxID=3157039 RepID=UPI0033A68E1D